jgi:PAS domain S-box-containing protein
LNNENLYRTLIEASPDAIVMYSLDGVILAANTQGAQVYGVSSVDELFQEVKTVSGGETFDRLRGINPEVRVLLSSGYSING